MHPADEQQPVNEEWQQTVTRLILSGSTFIYAIGMCYFRLLNVTFLWIATIFLVFSLIWTLFVKYYPLNKLRRWQKITRIATSILADMTAISLGIYYSGNLGAYFYPFYLWVIVGNGVRFGPQYLFFSMVVALTGFSLILTFSQYWWMERQVWYGLTFGIVLLPIFFLKILRRLHTLNTQLEQSLINVTHAATHDFLSGFFNRNFFFQQVHEEIKKINRYGGRVALLYLDLDRFKEVNDLYGHLAGDLILQEAANRLSTSIRNSDILSRLGGDEFGLLLINMDSKESLEVIVTTLLKRLSEPYADASGTILTDRISVSIGVCFYPNPSEENENAETLIQKADLAMYEAKKQGKGRWVQFH